MTRGNQACTPTAPLRPIEPHSGARAPCKLLLWQCGPLRSHSRKEALTCRHAKAAAKGPRQEQGASRQRQAPRGRRGAGARCSRRAPARSSPRTFLAANTSPATASRDSSSPTLFDAPLLYAKRLIEGAVSVARRSAVAIAVSSGLVLLLLYLLRGPNRLALLRQSVQPKDLLVIAALASMFVPPWLLSFDDRRYYVVPIVFRRGTRASREIEPPHGYPPAEAPTDPLQRRQ